MDDTHFAENYGGGFIRLLDTQGNKGSHYIRAAHVVSIQPQFICDQWQNCEVITIDGSRRRVNASVEQILAAMDATDEGAPVPLPGDQATFDCTHAMAEGWGIFQASGDGRWYLDRDDEQDAFPDGVAAFHHVERLANAGSAYHKAALAWIDRANGEG